MNKPIITLRNPQPGDMGWVVQQHGEIYWREYGWDMRFEALVAGIVSGYVTNYQSDFEKCWIAEVRWRAGRVCLCGAQVPTFYGHSATAHADPHA